MKSMVKLLTAFLVFSILSFGFTGLASAQQAVPPLSLQTELPVYGEGDTIVIFGLVKASLLDKDNQVPVLLRVLSSTGNMVTVEQLMPDAQGNFSAEMKASGPLWKAAGEYTVAANYQAQSINITFHDCIQRVFFAIALADTFHCLMVRLTLPVSFSKTPRLCIAYMSDVKYFLALSAYPSLSTPLPHMTRRIAVECT